MNTRFVLYYLSQRFEKVGELIMKKSNGKFFIGIGVLLMIAGFILLPDDQAIGVVGILLGGYNIYKGVQLLRGIQPMLIRKQQERDRKVEEELRNEMKSSDEKTEDHKNKRDN